MKKLKRANLAELAKSKTIISFIEQRRYVGGGSGTQEDAFTYDELMCGIANNSWSGGWVQGVVNSGNALSYCGGTGEPIYVSANLMYKGGTGSQANTIYDGGTGYQGYSEYNGGTLGYSDKPSYHIVYSGQTADNNSVSNLSVEKIKKLMDATGDYSFTITSTTRSPHDQARIMYENIQKRGLSKQKTIYNVPGQSVLDVYNPRLSKEENIDAMERKINEVGATKVSKHCADNTLLNVIDIADTSISDKAKFEQALKANGIKYLKENNCYHLEIKQK